MIQEQVIALLTQIEANADKIQIPTYPHPRSGIMRADLVNVVYRGVHDATKAIEERRFAEALMVLDNFGDYYWAEGNPSICRVLGAIKEWLFAAATGEEDGKRSPRPLVDTAPEPKKVFTVVCVANDWGSSNNSYVSFAEADNPDAAAEEVLEGLREEDEAGVREPDDPDKWTVIAVFEGRHMDRFPQ